jgi:predicted dienelactone hydrolase
MMSIAKGRGRHRALWLTLLAAGPAQGQAPYGYGQNCRTWPAIRGRYSVGTIDFEMTDSIRSAQYAPVPTPVRRIYVRAWYPAKEVGAAPLRPYFTKAESTVLMTALLKVLQRPADAMGNCAGLATNAHQGAPPAPGRFPVVTFNHGFASHALQNTALLEHLAANGYVALSFGHPYETSGIVYPNGDSLTLGPALYRDLEQFATLPEPVRRERLGDSPAERLRRIAPYIEAIRHGSFGQLPAVWREDTNFVLDRLKGTAVPDEIKSLAGAIDHDRRAHAGMSFGGYIAALTAQGDPRARAAVNLDGGNWTYDLIDADVRTPFLMLNSDVTFAPRLLAARHLPLPAGMYLGPRGPRAATIGDLAYERGATAGIRSDILRFMVPRVMHEAFTDQGVTVQDTLIRFRLGDSAAAARNIQVQNDLVLGFLDRFVKGEANGFPGTPMQRYPDLIQLDRTKGKTR